MSILFVTFIGALLVSYGLVLGICVAEWKHKIPKKESFLNNLP